MEVLIRRMLSATKACSRFGGLAKLGVIPGGGGITPMGWSR